MQMNVLKVLILLFVSWGLLFFSSIASTVAIWDRSETFAHCFMILPICVYLIQQKWQEFKFVTLKPNYWVLVPIIISLLMWLFGNLAQILFVEQGAAFLLLPLLIWLVFGNSATKIIAFPLMFWMFSVPVGEFLIPQLQDLTAEITVFALQLTNIPVYREGLYIAVPGGLFEVAVACSGIRYLMASFTLGTLFAYLSYTKRHKQIIFVIFSLVLPLLANGIRAYGIVLIAYLSDMQYATGVDHLIYGWLWFGVVILVMFAIGNIWRDTMAKPEANAGSVGSQLPLMSIVKPLGTFIVLILGVFVYGYNAESPNVKHHPDLQSIVPAKQIEGGLHWSPIFNNPTKEFVGQDDNIEVYIAYFESNKQDSELINSNNHIFNFKAWSKVVSQPYEHFSTVEINNFSGQRRLIAYTYVTAWEVGANPIKIKLSQALEALLGQPQTGFFIAVSVPLASESPNKQYLLEYAQRYLTPQLSEKLHD